MKFGQWVLGAVVAGLALGTAGAHSAPLSFVDDGGSVAVQSVQYYYYDDEPPVVYEPRRSYYDYEPAPRRYYEPSPRVYYDSPPRHAYEPPRRAQGYKVPVPGRRDHGVIYDKEAAKDYMKAYRRQEKDEFKARQRAWNRANGY